MKRAMAFLACTSSSTYTKVAKIMKLLHISISMVYQKTATLINTENDKAYCLHIKKQFAVLATMHIARIGQASSELVQLLKIPPTSISQWKAWSAFTRQHR